MLDVPLWMADAVGTWESWSSRVMPLDRNAAVTMALAALTCWLFSKVAEHYESRCRQLKAEYDRREAALIQTASWLTAPTQPLPRLRSVHSAP